MKNLIVVALATFMVAGIGKAMWEASDPQLKHKKDRQIAAQRAEQERARKEQADSWTKWFEEMKQKNANRPKQEVSKEWDQGFKTGYMAGFMLARGGAVKKQSAEIDGMSRRAATAAGMSDDVARYQFTTGYGDGFDFGWSKGR